jgi:hypothetical protein
VYVLILQSLCDDSFSMENHLQLRNKLVVSTGVIMGLWPTQGDEKRLPSSNCFPLKRRPSLCHPERSRGICSSADLSWKCFSTERSGVERSAVSFSCVQLEPTAAWHAHDQFGLGIIDSRAQLSWSGIGQVEAWRGDVIMVNPEFHPKFPRTSRVINI